MVQVRRFLLALAFTPPADATCSAAGRLARLLCAVRAVVWTGLDALWLCKLDCDLIPFTRFRHDRKIQRTVQGNFSCKADSADLVQDGSEEMRLCSPAFLASVVDRRNAARGVGELKAVERTTIVRFRACELDISRVLVSHLNVLERARRLFLLDSR
jgi:hypothetical protein